MTFKRSIDSWTGSLPGYDAWLERPYQERYAHEPPPEVEDMLDTEFDLDGEHAVVEGYEEWQDADEDGAYGGIDYVIRIGGHRDLRYNYWTGGRTQNMSETELEEALANQPKYWNVLVAINTPDRALTVGYKMIPADSLEQATTKAREWASEQYGGKSWDWHVERVEGEEQ